MKKYSKVADQQGNYAKAASVRLERTYAEVDDADQKEVHADQLRKAFYYGKELVPVSQENEAVLKGHVVPKAAAEKAPAMNGDANEERKDGAALEESKDDDRPPKRAEDIAMGVNGDEQRTLKMLGFAD